MRVLHFSAFICIVITVVYSYRGTDLEIDNYQSVNRRLDQVLYLLVKKPRQRFSWQFPQGGIDPGESLVQV